MAPTRDEDSTMLAKSLVRHAADTAGSARGHYLLVVDGPDKGRRIPLGTAPVVLGRSAPADVVLADPQISRSHCRVCVAMNEVIVIDLESSNGTYVDGKRLSGGGPLAVGARLQVGSYVLEHEFRIRKEVEDSQELDRDIEQAAQYIRSLLPAPLAQGPIRTDWVLVPCTRLGGDVFGYRFLDETHFAIYLADVSGHGTGAAMHAVSVLNVLRQNALPAADYRNPSQVLAALNTMFRMETHGNLYLTLWYGVYEIDTHVLTYACAGHHQSYLVGSGRAEAVSLRTRNPVIGVAPGVIFKSEATRVPTGSSLYVFSDGVFEVTCKTETDLEIEDFATLVLGQPVPGLPESQRLLQCVRSLARNPGFDDDFTLMALTFLEAGATDRPPDATWPSRA